MNPTAPVIELLSVAQLDPDLTAKLGPERAGAWTRNREPYRPQVTVLHLPDGEAAALTTGRPNTKYTKVVDIWSTTDAAAAQLLEHLISGSRERGDACLKWQLPIDEELPKFAADLGFVELTTPIPSDAGTEQLRGFAVWHGGWPHPQLRYYSQTTDFTCGAVAAMTALTALGLDPFGVASDTGARDQELAFWRSATNFPACEPVGLAVAVHDALHHAVHDESVPVSAHRVELHLDADAPVLVEDYAGIELEFRSLLQAESARQANSRGIDQNAERVAATEILRRVAGGDYALLLINDGPMHATSSPHWVLAHAVQGDTALLHDPWVTDESGETWVDSHDLPITVDALDRLVSWGDPGYRGVIFITR